MKVWLLIFSFLLIFQTSCSSSSNTDDNDDNDQENVVSISLSGDVRTITSNGIPDHGIDSDNTYANTLDDKDLVFTMDATPEKATSISDYAEPDKFGVAINGIPFDPFTAEYFQNDKNSGWHKDATGAGLDLDKYGAHIQPDGTYHYHSVKSDFFTVFGVKAGEHSPLVGYAADGFPIYAKYVYSSAQDASSAISELQSNYQLKSGNRAAPPNGPGGIHDGTYIEDYEYVESLNSDLNEANARFGVTPEFPNGTWYYVLTENFPYIPIKFMGESDASFEGGSGPQGLQVMGHHHVHNNE